MDKQYDSLDKPSIWKFHASWEGNCFGPETASEMAPLFHSKKMPSAQKQTNKDAPRTFRVFVSPPAVNTHLKVRIVELVGDVPAEAPVLLPLVNHGVEEAQAEQQVPPLGDTTPS